MTDSNVLRAKIIEAMAKALALSDFPYIPTVWENSTTLSVKGRQHYLDEAETAFDAQHGLACVVPPKATEDMAAAIPENCDYETDMFDAMAEAGDLTKDTPK